MKHRRDEVLEALRVEDVIAHYSISGRFNGRWMRSRRCPTDDHGTFAMALARDGMWKCHACDVGGDLLDLIAIAERLDIRSDFGAVLDAAAEIAGMVDPDGFVSATPRPRPPRPELPRLPPLRERLAVAIKRATWTWANLREQAFLTDAYLRSRGLDPVAISLREQLREAPIAWRPEVEPARDSDLARHLRICAPIAIGVQVRSVVDDVATDIRLRRVEPRENQPKVIGMLAGVTSDDGRLVACYGRPAHVDADLVVVAEGLFDYLTALQLWPGAAVLGAPEAGSVPLVAEHAARAVAARGRGRVLLIEQNDGEGGAADLAVNAAAKRAIALLGPGAVGQLLCGPAHKDLNELFSQEGERAVHAGIRWWSDE